MSQVSVGVMCLKCMCGGDVSQVRVRVMCLK